VSDTPDPEPDTDHPRQRIIRSRSGRRAKLTPAPGTIAEPGSEDGADAPPDQGSGASGPNDERMRRDVPPHY
jgi:hypothetical protein